MLLATPVPLAAMVPRALAVCRTLFLLFMLALSAACAPSATTQAPVESAAEPAPHPASEVVIGTTLSLSGRFSGEGAALKAGYDTWLRAVNDAGGLDVAGARRLARLIVYDDESDPLTAARSVERLVQRDGVSLLLGPFSSQITTAVATSAERLGALTVAPDASAPSLYGRDPRMLVSILPTDDRYLEGLLELASGLSPRPRPIALLIPDEPLYVAAAEGFREGARTRGMEPILVERYALDAREIPESLDRIARARPQLLVVAGDPERLQVFLPQIRELRLAPPMRALIPTQRFHDLAKLGRGNLEGVLTVDWWSPELPASGPVFGSARDFADYFERLHGYAPDSRSAAAAAAALALQLAIERAGSVEPAQVRAGLAKLDAWTFWGRLAWDQVGRNRTGIVPVLQVQQGHPLVVHPSEFGSARLRYPIGGWP